MNEINEINDKYILKLIIDNLIPQSCKTNIKKEENNQFDIELNKNIEDIIKLWSESQYDINHIINTFQQKISKKETLYYYSFDEYSVSFNEKYGNKNDYKIELINIFNIETEDIKDIYSKLNVTNIFNNDEIQLVKNLLNKHKNEKIYFGINDNNYYSFYLLSFETPNSTLKNNWFFYLDKPLYKLNIFMILIFKK